MADVQPASGPLPSGPLPSGPLPSGPLPSGPLPSGPPPTQRSLIWLQGLVCGALVAVATPTALLVVGLFAPVAVAYTLDRVPGRPVARTVLLFALAGGIGTLRALWAAGHSLSIALALLADPAALVSAWSAAAAGWLLAELSPVLVRVALELASRARIVRLRAARARYEAEWGLPPQG